MPRLAKIDKHRSQKSAGKDTNPVKQSKKIKTGQQAMISRAASAFFSATDRVFTEQRGQLIALLMFFWALFLASYLAVYLATNWDGTPMFGRDFSAFWSAAKLAVDGNALAVFDAQVAGELQRSVSNITGVLLWHYPATYHLLILPFGLLSYPVALALFSALSITAWIICVKRLFPGYSFKQLSPAFFAPAFWMSILQGQNGTFVALIMTFAFLAIQNSKTLSASFWIALLLIKPHFGVLFPVILLARRRWGIFFLTGVFCAVFIGLATLVFGLGYWQAFIENASTLTDAVTSGGLWNQQFSAFAFVSRLGGSTGLAIGLQVLTALVAGVLCARVWASAHSSWNLRGATFIFASLMVSPYAFQYDLVVSVVALALMVKEGRASGYLTGEKTFMALLWAAPFAHQYIATKTGFLIIYPIMLLALYMCWRRFRIRVSAP
jgi:glycosyl transferase family 87